MTRSFRRMPRAARRAVLVPGVLAAVLGIGVLGVASAAQATTMHAVAVAGQASPATAGNPATPATAGNPATPATAGSPTTTAGPTDPSGGICGVPGIGDIGGLLGFCNAGSSGLIGDLNNICQPSVEAPEAASSGIDSLIQPPATSAAQPDTLYERYGMAGQSWGAYDMQCSDMTSLIGNDVSNMVFDAAKALDRVTITVYQSAAGEGILSWLTGAVNRLISSLGKAIYFPYLAPVVILGAIWLAWQGLIRRRATLTIEGTIWMVVACAAAIWLIGRPADFTGLGKSVSNGITQTLNVAFAGLPSPAASPCVPVQGKDPQVTTASYSFTGGSTVVDQNADELWSVLVCQPWLDGEFGTTTYGTGRDAKATVVNTYARQLLWSQAIATNENPTPALIQAKEDSYAGIAASIKQNNPDVYSLFQGNQYPTRLEIAFSALLAGLVAGVLVLLIAVTLIILKLGFLLLLVAGPFFLIVGTHPGFGRVVALRWAEMLIGVLLKQAAVALVLSILLYAYSLIMGTSNATLPWALKILMIALVTVAVFIYRKPFSHLFSAVGYGMVGARDRASETMKAARETARGNTVEAATVGVPGFAGYRAARWARRNPEQAATVATVAAAAGVGAAAGASAAVNAAVGRTADDGQPAAEQAGEDGADEGQGRASRSGAGIRARAGDAAGGEPDTRSAPPLDLPDRRGNGQRSRPSGWSRDGGLGTGTGRSGQDADSGPAQTVPQPRQAMRPSWWLSNPTQGGSGQGGGRQGGSGQGGGRQAGSGQGSSGQSGSGQAGSGQAGGGQAGSGQAGGGHGGGGADRGGQAPPQGPFWTRSARRKK